jgi:hypothetical protein
MRHGSGTRASTQNGSSVANRTQELQMPEKSGFSSIWFGQRRLKAASPRAVQPCNSFRAPQRGLGSESWVTEHPRAYRELRRIRSRRAHSAATAYSRRNRQLQQIVASARKASSRPAGRRVAVPASADGLRPPEWRERILAWMGSSLTFIRQLTQGQSYTRR